MLIALSPARARLPAHCEYAGAIGSHAERALALQDLFRPAAAGGRPGRAGQAGWTGAKKFGRAKKIFPGQQKKKNPGCFENILGPSKTNPGCPDFRIFQWYLHLYCRLLVQNLYHVFSTTPSNFLLGQEVMPGLQLITGFLTGPSA